MGRGRPHSTVTPLGRALADRDIPASELCHAARINQRTMTEYLAGRKQIPPHHLADIAESMNMRPEDLLYTVPEDITA